MLTKRGLVASVGCMKNVALGTNEGVFEVRLDDLATVRRWHAVIAAALGNNG